MMLCSAYVPTVFVVNNCSIRDTLIVGLLSEDQRRMLCQHFVDDITLM